MKIKWVHEKQLGGLPKWEWAPPGTNCNKMNTVIIWKLVNQPVSVLWAQEEVQNQLFQEQWMKYNSNSNILHDFKNSIS